MTDDDKMAAFKALAGDLGKSMKDKVVKAGEEAKALQERLNIEREKMLRILEGDIDVLGWDQAAKAYAVTLAEDGTEMLNLIDSLEGHPVDTLMRLAVTGELRNEAVALVVTNESWAYPDYLEESLKGDARARRALWACYPPQWHPDRVEGRMVTLVDRTGQAVNLYRKRGEPAMSTSEPEESLVNAMKCLLGIDREFNRRRKIIGKSFDAMTGMLKMFREGTENCWTEQMYIDAITKILEPLHKDHVKEHPDCPGPAASAEDLMRNMPTDLRRMLGLE